MKKSNLFLLFLIVLVLNCKPDTKGQNENKLPRVAIAGLGIESSTFSPAQTNEEAFHARIGDSIFGRYPFFDQGTEIRKRADWVPTLLGKALPGGIVTREAYESMVDKTLKMLKQNGPYDGLFLISMVQ